MRYTMQMQTIEACYATSKNEAHYWTTNNWRTLCNCKQIKHITQLQTYESNNDNANKSTLWKCEHMKHTMFMQKNYAHYVTANSWSTLSKFKQIKNTMQLQANEEHYASANKWSTLCNFK